MDVLKDINTYLSSWQDDPRQVRPFFMRLLEKLHELGAMLEFVVREGVSTSLRARAGVDGGKEQLFCLVDIVQDADGPWLSVCFYADLVTDYDQRGNLVPMGLLGDDGYCFDMEGSDPEAEEYVLNRVVEAHGAVFSTL